MQKTKWRRPRPGGPDKTRGGETTAFRGRGGAGRGRAAGDPVKTRPPLRAVGFWAGNHRKVFLSAVSCLRDALAAFHVRKPCKTHRSQIASYLWHAIRGLTQRLENEAMPRYPAVRAADPVFFVGCLVNGGGGRGREAQHMPIGPLRCRRGPGAPRRDDTATPCLQAAWQRRLKRAPAKRPLRCGSVRIG